MAAPINNNFANATNLSLNSYNVVTVNGRLTEATTEANEPLGIYYLYSDYLNAPSIYNLDRTVWYKFTAPNNNYYSVTLTNFDNTYNFTPVLTVYTGSALTNLTILKQSTQGSWDAKPPNAVYFQAVSGTTYYFQVGTSENSGFFFTLSVSPTSRPSNDNFADATLISGSLPITLSYQDNRRASYEIDEINFDPLLSFNDKTIWYKWIAPTTRTYRLEASLSTYSGDWTPQLMILTGSTLSSLSLQDQTEFYPLFFEAIAGTTYYFRFNGTYEASGQFHLTLSEFTRPMNDNFANAILLTGSEGIISDISTVGATLDINEPNTIGNPTIWYRVVSSSNSDYEFKYTFTVSSGFYIALYKGTTINTLEPIKVERENDPSYPSGASKFVMEPNTTYYFQIFSVNYLDPNLGTLIWSCKPLFKGWGLPIA